MKHEKNLKLIDGKWTVDIEIMGKRLRRNFQTKTEAEIALTVLRNQRNMQRLGIEVPEAKSSGILFKDFSEKVIAGLGATRYETRKSRRVCLNALLASKIFDGKQLGEITSEDVANYHTARAEKKPSANAELGFLKMVFKRAVEWGELTRNPAGPVKPFKLEQNRLRILTDRESELLFASSAPELIPLLQLLLTTGMRPHEAFSLRWEYDGWDTAKDPLEAVLVLGRAMIFIPGGLAKNHKNAAVPISRKLVEMFSSIPRTAKSIYVFPWRSTPLSFYRAVKEAKLKNVSLYTLKHTCASNWINKDHVDIVTVSELLRHSDIQMTMRYCHSNETSKREAVEKASQRVFKPAPVADAPAATQPEGQTEASETVN